MNIRPADLQKDLERLKLLWRDAAWDTVVEDYEAELRLLPSCKTLIADDSGQGIDAAVIVMEGDFQFQGSSLPLSAVLAVLTASHARRRGYSSRTLATMLEQERARGAVVAILGAFDEGYYDRLGFGSCGYDPVMIVDPAALRIPEAARHALDDPRVHLRRITVDDAAALYSARLRRPRGHGACTAGNDGFIRSVVASAANKGFGLAICEREQGGAGEEHIRAHFFGTRLNEEQLDIIDICADSAHDYLQILEVIHRLSDQLEQVKIPTPPSIHIHDLLARPLRDGIVPHPHPFDTLLLWQLRILDLPRAVDAVRLPIAEPLRFRLQISDPVAAASPSGWSGCDGSYEVLLGPRSHCTPLTAGVSSNGAHSSESAAAELPLLDASIGAFSRFWAGAVRPATLCNSDHFHAPPELITALEQRYVVPPPQREWGF